MKAAPLTFTLSCLLATVCTGAPQATAPPAGRSAPRPAGKAAPAMTNADVLKMVKAGLGEPVVTAAIRGARKTAFELSPDGLIELKTSGVSDSIIAVMLDPAAAPVVVAAAPAPAPAPTPTPTSDPNDPLSPHDPGIYMMTAGEAPRLVVLEPTSFKQGKSGGWLGSAMTMGIKKMKWKAIVPAPRAVQRTTSGLTPFYFYFEKKSSMDDVTNPSEFVLARMKRKDDERELIVGEAGALGASSGTREKDAVEFRTETLAPCVYKVTPGENLAPGEYCFFKATGSANITQAGATGHLFDFGVDG